MTTLTAINTSSKLPDKNIITQYLHFLCRNQDDTIVTLCFMDSVSEKPIKGYACVHCRVCEVIGAWEEVSRLSPNCTVHITLNETDLKGRRTENITCVRVLCVDIDQPQGGELELGCLGTNAAMASPDIVIQSSPGKYHLYWRLSQAVPIERWQKYQIGFAHKMGGDKSLSNAVSMIRVPGFWRTCKDGAEFLPTIISAKDSDTENELSINGLPEASIIKVFPWIVDAIETGTKQLKDERKKAGEWARKLWSARKTSSNGGSGETFELKNTPELGRNVTLYMVLKDTVANAIISRADIDFDEVFKLAEAVNTQFKHALGYSELRKTVHSALQRGRYSGEAQLAKLDYLDEVPSPVASKYETDNKMEPRGLIATLAPTNTLAGSAALTEGMNMPSENNNISTALDFTSDAKLSQDKLSQDSETGNGVSSNGHLKLIINGLDANTGSTEASNDIEMDSIPTSLESVGEQLTNMIWQSAESRKDAARALRSALSTKNYNLYASWICGWYQKIGVFRKGGVGVYIRGHARWGSDVFYCEHVGKEAFISLISRVVTKIGRKCVRHKVYKSVVSKLPTQTAARGIGEAAWGLAILEEKQERQSPDVIVFQNGVFNLVTGSFSLDNRAAVRYSHAVWCKFDLETARQWLESQKELKGLHSAPHSAANPNCCPTCPAMLGRDWSKITGILQFLEYMHQWFPGDNEIIEVVLRWFGYGMTTDTSRNKFSFFYGPTRAGKGSICRTFCGLVGDVNYSVSDYEALGGGFKAANFMDKLLICIEEVEGTVKEHEVRMGYLKKLLGGEKICVERKYEQPYEDRLVGKFVLQSNEAPVYQDKGHALRARMLAVGFEKSFEAEGGSIDPAEIILNNDSSANALGTVAALSWWIGRKDKNRTFELPECHALEVGKTEIVAGLDMFELIATRYFMQQMGESVESGICTDILNLVTSTRGIGKELGQRKEYMLRMAIERLYPAAKHSTHVRTEHAGAEHAEAEQGMEQVGGKRVRGYENVTVRKETVLQDFEEILLSSAGQFERLKQFLKITLKDEAICFI